MEEKGGILSRMVRVGASEGIRGTSHADAWRRYSRQKDQ
jgi:hypothetical protein